MIEPNIQQFIAAARQYLFGAGPAASRLTTVAIARIH